MVERGPESDNNWLNRLGEAAKKLGIIILPFLVISYLLPTNVQPEVVRDGLDIAALGSLFVYAAARANK